MKRSLLFIAVAIVSIIVETTLLRTFPTWSIRCDFVWLTILFIGFYHDLWEGILSVLFIGYIMDCVASPFLGLLTATYLIVFFVLRMLTVQIYVEALLSKIFWVFMMTLLGKYVEFLLLIWLDAPVVPQPFMIFQLFVQGIWNGILAIIFFPILKRLISWVYKKDYAYTVSSR